MPRRCPRSFRRAPAPRAARTAWPPAPRSCRPGTGRSRSPRRLRSRAGRPDLRLRGWLFPGRLLGRLAGGLAHVEQLDLVERVLDRSHGLLWNERKHLPGRVDCLLRLHRVLRTLYGELLAREVHEGRDRLKDHILSLDLLQGLEELLLGGLLGLVHVATSSAA